MIALGGVAVAQAEPEVPTAAAEGDEPGPEAKGKGRVRDPLLVAISLPQAAQAARAAGIPEDEVKAALRAEREAGVDAVSAAESMRRSAKAAREHGVIEGYGAFVKDQLANGKRGKELSEAIAAVHAERGQGGKGKGKGTPGGEGEAPDAMGKPEAEGGAPDAGPNAGEGKKGKGKGNKAQGGQE